jgi:hypothetical protein
MSELQKTLNEETLRILAKQKKTLDDWLELEITKLRVKEGD